MYYCPALLENLKFPLAKRVFLFHQTYFYLHTPHDQMVKFWHLKGAKHEKIYAKKHMHRNSVAKKISRRR